MKTAPTQADTDQIISFLQDYLDSRVLLCITLKNGTTATGELAGITATNDIVLDTDSGVQTIARNLIAEIETKSNLPFSQ